MPRKLDPEISEILKAHGCGKDDVWDCHGTWVVLHKTLEKIAAKEGVQFDPPQIIEANSKDKIVAVCVVGRKGDKVEWSFGEAAPGNNKNSYPYAMAEKRAKDRVILKLVGLHGWTYSEDEADDFRETIARANQDAIDAAVKKAVSEAKQKAPGVHPPDEDMLDWGDVLRSAEVVELNASNSRPLYKTLLTAMRMATTRAELAHFAHENTKEIWQLHRTARHHLREEYNKLEENL